jgi:hypothetical protein
LAGWKTVDFSVLCSLPIDNRSPISVIKSRSSPPAQFLRGTGNEAARRPLRWRDCIAAARIEK